MDWDYKGLFLVSESHVCFSDTDTMEIVFFLDFQGAVTIMCQKTIKFCITYSLMITMIRH